MKRCSSCQGDYPETSFSFQRTNPTKRYAWCDDCRSMSLPKCSLKTKGYAGEMAELKAQAERNRKFDRTAAAALLIERQSATVKSLAQRHGVSVHCISDTLKRAKREARVES